MSKNYDVIIVGAGIVGLAIAYELKSCMPELSIAMIEKESRLGVHASGRNSGVLHTGIYYPAHTLKAKVCAEGSRLMRNFADEQGIAYRKLGKLIVATTQEQKETLSTLMDNAKANAIRATYLDEQALREYEPSATRALAAIYCPDTAVIDSLSVLLRLQALLQQQNVDFFFDCEVSKLLSQRQLMTNQGLFSYGYLYNCAGAHADTLAHQLGLAENYNLVPFKGLYWKLSPEANSLVRENIYPAPDLRLPFLGVHLTRVMSGDVYVGPTAIPVLGRENYKRLQGAHFAEAWAIASQMMQMYFRNQNNFRLLAKMELAKYSKKTFLAAAQQLVPSLKAAHLVPTSKAGIRPQLVNIKTKKLEMDYVLQTTDYSIHVLNAISPAFTSSFAFAKMIIQQTTMKGSAQLA